MSFRRKLGISAALIVSVFTQSCTPADQSCHNPLRDGRTSIDYSASFDLRVGIDQWRSVEEEIVRFQRTGEWSVRSNVRTEEEFPWFQVSLCKEEGTIFFVQGMEDFGVVSFGVYQPQGDETWRGDFQKLYELIRARWPGEVVFRNNEGQETSTPEWASSQQTRPPHE